MPSPEYSDEEKRLRVLEDFQAEALEDDPELQAIVNFAAKLCNVPASMVTLLDDRRQFFLARTGVDQRETPRGISFCTHALGQSEIMEVADAALDARFADNPLVTGDPHVRYYAGQPLVSDEGAPLGTLCVIDLQPHAEALNEFQREGLAVLAQAAMRRLRSRRQGLVATREIERSEARFKALADSMPDIAFSANQDGVFDYFNRRWQEFTGAPLPYNEEIGRTVLHPDDYQDIIDDWMEAIATRKPYERENRLRRADGQYRWMLVRALPVKTGVGDRIRWFGTMTDIDDAHKLSESRDMLAKELSHRIKNIFAVVSGLVSLQARKEPEHKDFAETLNDTLRALGRAHDFVRPASGSTRESLKGLLEVVFAPYRAAGQEPRVIVTGQESAVGQAAATSIALIFHELATNSAKYGALSVDGGTVTLNIAEDGEQVHLLWQEHGGPPPQDNGKSGFGSRLVDLTVTGQLQGSWERRFEPAGLVVELVLPRDAIAPMGLMAETEAST
ncbi:sensor histidine kinase [Alteraurantiacibacter aestuarii]|nr:PAS domain S-box protein [Alteraurantiacibacter aestuarii]